MSAKIDDESIQRLLPTIRGLVPSENIPEPELMAFIRSPMFREVFPDIHELMVCSSLAAAASKTKVVDKKNEKMEVSASVVLGPALNNIKPEIIGFNEVKDENNILDPVIKSVVSFGNRNTDSKSSKILPGIVSSPKIDMITLDSESESATAVSSIILSGVDSYVTISKSHTVFDAKTNSKPSTSKVVKNGEGKTLDNNSHSNFQPIRKENQTERSFINDKKDKHKEKKLQHNDKDKTRKRDRKAAIISSSSSDIGSQLEKRRPVLKKKKQRVEFIEFTDSDESIDLVKNRSLDPKGKKRKKNRDRSASGDLEKSFLRELKKMKTKTSKKKNKKISVVPFSLYSHARSTITKPKHWKPHVHPKFNTLQNKYKLKMLTVPCVDLLNMETFFHKQGSQNNQKCLTSIPLKKRVTISKEKAAMIGKMEKLKCGRFKSILNHLYAKQVTKPKTSAKGKDSNESKPKKIVQTFDLSGKIFQEKGQVITKRADDKFTEKTKTKSTPSPTFFNMWNLPTGLKPVTKVEQKQPLRPQTFPSTNICSERILPKKDNFSKRTDDSEVQLLNHKNINVQVKQKPPAVINKLCNQNPVYNMPSTSKAAAATNAWTPTTPPVVMKPVKPVRMRCKERIVKPSVEFISTQPAKLKVKSRYNPILSVVQNEQIARIKKSIERLETHEASKPLVPLIIPKGSSNNDHLIPVVTVGDISKGSVAWGVQTALSKHGMVELPAMPTEFVTGYELSTYTSEKIAWWFLKNDQNPANRVLFHPELHDNDKEEYSDDESYGLITGDDDDSSLGCVSDNEDGSIFFPGSTKTFHDADRLDEYCGAASLEAKIRYGKTKNINSSEDLQNFHRFIVARPGTNYEKSFFEAKCKVCFERIVGHRMYGVHVRSQRHKNHLRNFSLKMANYEELSVKVSPAHLFNAKLKVYSTLNTDELSFHGVYILLMNLCKGDLCASLCGLTETKTPSLGNDDCVILDSAAKDSKQTSSKSDDAASSLPNFEMFRLGQDNQLRDAKLALRVSGKWNRELDIKWEKMTEEEARLKKEYNELREKYVEAPASHPQHDQEWFKFWNRRCTEMRAEGLDPDNHNFGPEWLKYWFTEMQEIMKEDAEQEISEMRMSLGVDIDTLRILKNEKNPGFQTHAQNVPGINQLPSRGRGHSNHRGRGHSNYRGRGRGDRSGWNNNSNFSGFNQNNFANTNNTRPPMSRRGNRPPRPLKRNNHRGFNFRFR